MSIFHEVTDRLALMGDFGWDNWSQFGKVDVSVSTISVTTSVPFQDTYHTGIGGQYQLNPDWRLNAGFGYDSSMIKDQDRPVTLPVGATYKYGFGAEWQATEKYNIGMNYELTWPGDLPVHNNALLPGPVASRGNVAGSFNNTTLHFFAFNVRF